MNSGTGLQTRLGTLNLVNPFILASGPPTASGEMIRRAFAAGWGGAVIKTIRPDGMVIRDLSPRFGAWRGEKGELLGFENYELLSRKTVSYWTAEIGAIRQEFPDRILIASIMGDTDPATWQNLACQVREAGADAIELNMSCPHGMPEAGVGSAIGQNPAMVRELTRVVVSVVDIPVYVKLTPNITDIAPAAVAAAEGGAGGISAINTIQCLIGVDLETLVPLPAAGGYSTPGGYSGPAVRPVGLLMVSRIARAVPLPIMGIGGISRWQDAAEYLLLGASAVQVCTAVMWNGYGIIRDFTDGLSEYLALKGWASPDAMRGRSLTRLASHQEMDRTSRVHPVAADPASCRRCGSCVTACRDGGYQAITLTRDGPAIDLSRCDGCGLCLLVCGEGCLQAVEEVHPRER